MYTISRNDACPCGSGKKFKQCCLIAQPPRYRVMRAVHWSPDEIRAFTTEQIIRKLREFGVEFNQDQFLADVRRFSSAEAITEQWHKSHRIIAPGLDHDFIWMAAIVLWERLAPDVANTETLDDMIQQGYDLVESQREPEGCSIWLKVWEQLKTQLTPEPKSIRDIDKVFNGSVFLSDWLSDLEMELHNAGLQDRTFFEKRVEYSRELYTLFPKSDSLTLLNAKRAEAESLFSLGKAEEGERAFEALIKEFPDSAWGYIGWGDMYGPFRTNEETELNFDKAEKIYRLGLGRATEDRDVIQDRLEDLEEEKKKHLSAQ